MPPYFYDFANIGSNEKQVLRYEICHKRVDFHIPPNKVV